MLNLSTRSSEPEILDNFDLNGHDLSENLRELEKVNQYLGGYRAVYEGVEKIIKRKALKGTLNVVDLGTGGGDNLKALAAWSRKKGINLSAVGVDASEPAVDYARRNTADYPEVDIERGNIFDLDLSGYEADIFMFNLVLHHFSDKEIAELLTRCVDAGGALLINDLHRSYMAYQLFRLASRAMRFSHIGRHDGKLSIQKSFTKHEWQKLLANAGIKDFEIRWHWAFRYLVLVY